MTGVAVSREWSNYLKTPRVNNVKSDIVLSASPTSADRANVNRWR